MDSNKNNVEGVSPRPTATAVGVTSDLESSPPPYPPPSPQRLFRMWSHPMPSPTRGSGKNSSQTPTLEQSLILQPFYDAGYDCSALYPQTREALHVVSKRLRYYLVWASIFSDFFNAGSSPSVLDLYSNVHLKHAIQSKNPFVIAHVLNLMLREDFSPEKMQKSEPLRSEIVLQLIDIHNQFPLFGHYLNWKYLNVIEHYQPAGQAMPALMVQKNEEREAMLRLGSSNPHPMDSICMIKNEREQPLYRYTTQSVQLFDDELSHPVPSFINI